MRRWMFWALGLVAACGLQAATISENFSTDPLSDGWQSFGNTNLFQWDSANHVLEVTWDSSQPNSYFYHPLGTILNRNDDFALSFDLLLQDIGPGPDPSKTGPFQLAVGFLNLDEAEGTNFFRGTSVNSPDLAEFNYFFAGYYPDYPFLINATTQPEIISSSNKFAPTDLADYEFELQTGAWVHVAMNYTAANQTLVFQVTDTNGVPLFSFPNVVLTNPLTSQLTTASDYHLNAVAINSYNDTGAYGSSLFANGSVGNIAVTIPPPPIQNLTGAFSNGVWQARFLSRSNWLYVLQRTGDLRAWTSASGAAPGNAGILALSDTNTSAARAIYRVRAYRP